MYAIRKGTRNGTGIWPVVHQTFAQNTVKINEDYEEVKLDYSSHQHFVQTTIIIYFAVLLRTYTTTRVDGQMDDFNILCIGI